MPRRSALQAVIFDNDGLLLDTEQAWTRAEIALFARRGTRFTPAHKRALLGCSRIDAEGRLEAMLQRRGEGHALVEELYELVLVEALRGVCARPGAPALLYRLRARKVPLAVASNSAVEFLRRTLASAGLLHGTFEAIVSAEEVSVGKPAPDVYLEAARRLNADPRRCVALEDSPIGALAAARAGMAVIGVPYFEDERIDGVDLLASSLAEDTIAQALGLCEPLDDG